VTAPGAHALRELVLSVVVVAASEAEATSCATSTTSYVSLSPPILAIALRPDSKTAQMVLRTGQFSVSVLTAAQAELARRAGRPTAAADKMAELGITPEWPAEPGPPGAAGSAAVLWCTVTSTVTAGDSLVIFGQVTSFRGAIGDDPLLIRHQRRFLATGPAVTPDEPEGYPI